MLRHHRLLETYLAEQLDVPWDRVHEEAEKLEHVISDDLVARIAAKLDDPTHDPHGDPIPAADLSIDDSPTRSLSAMETGEAGAFVRVSDSDPEMLRYLMERGIAIGDPVEILERQPFDGPLTVRIGTATHVLGGKLARAMRVVAWPDLLTYSAVAHHTQAANTAWTGSLAHSAQRGILSRSSPSMSSGLVAT